MSGFRAPALTLCHPALLPQGSSGSSLVNLAFPSFYPPKLPKLKIDKQNSFIHSCIHSSIQPIN